MIVSWNWLKRYVAIDATPDQAVEKLTMSGLNHEDTTQVGSDWAIDLEVTSNRPDCLCHIGIARELGVLFDIPITKPEPRPMQSKVRAADVCSVQIQIPQSCSRYTARIIRGVKIGPSPVWLQSLLVAVGVTPVNNVVDCTNFVMLECGQPLHAFDFAHVRQGKIIVRAPLTNESLTAIDHRSYSLTPEICMIADAERAIAIGGVMGGADSEVSSTSTEILIEAACFDPVSIRHTARRLNLHSPSSFRFERGVDSHLTDWASLRCSELILQTAGGELLEGMIDAGMPAPLPKAIMLRWSQVNRVLGIDVPTEFSLLTLERLGLQIDSREQDRITATPPPWRRDLEREVDLIEEIGRVYGYDKIPDDQPVPMAASHRPPSTRVEDKIRRVFVAGGFDEAMTPTLVPQAWSDAYSPWTDRPALESHQPMLGVLEKASQNIGPVSFVRRSLIPSLLEAKRINDYRSNECVELFEIAKVYLPEERGIPRDPVMCGLVSSRGFADVKGVVDALVLYLNPTVSIETDPCDHELLDLSRSAGINANQLRLGWIGQVSPHAKGLFGLRHDAVVAELDVSVLEKLAVLVPRQRQLSEYPPVTRDFNFVLADGVQWSKLEATVRDAAGTLLESIRYRETFRDEAKDGPGRKRLLLSVVLRSPDGTLTGDQLEQVSNQIISSCGSKLNASVVA